VQQHIEWNPTRQLWETEQADLFSELPVPFSETWPTSGMTRNGQLLPLETLVPPIDGKECSSSQLLPTPNAEVERGARPPEGIARRIEKGDKQFSLEDAAIMVENRLI
jgi:hypothetical protein